MAVPDYTPTPVPACVDSETVNTWLQNLNGLMEAGLIGTGGASCLPVQTNLTDGECLRLDSSDGVLLDNSQQSQGVIEKKIFLLTANITIGSLSESDLENIAIFDNSGILISYSLTAKCNGVTIAGSGVFTGAAGTTGNANITMIGECLTGQPMDICLDIISDNIQITNIRPGIFMQICGAVLCIREPQKGFLSDIPGYYCAPDVPPGCVIGREGLHLMQQNLQALCAFAAQGYLEASCDFSATFMDDDSHILGQPTSDVQYLIMGSAFVCASNNTQTNISSTFTAQVTGGCTNGTTTSCFPVTAVLNGSGLDGGPGTQVCVNVPFIACGNCLAGGSIFAGLNNSSVCGSTDTLQNSPSVTFDLVQQTYTLFTFRRVDPVAEGTLPIFQEQPIDKCISRESVEYLVEKSDALFDYFCARQEQEIGCQQISEGFGPISGGVIYSGVIRPPSQPPPPPEPIPTSKVNMFCMFRVCVRSLTPMIAQLSTITVTISCGGANPFTQDISCFIPASQTLSSDGVNIIGNDSLCKNVPIAHTYSGCPVNVPVLLDVTLTAGDVEVTGFFNCLSFNI